MFKPTTAPSSQLFNNDTFDSRFLKDIYRCQNTLLIESPFIRINRVLELLPYFKKLRQNNVRVIINTRPPEEHDGAYEQQALEAISFLQGAGVEILFTVRHHRKLAIIDRRICWEGSLNILSYYDSCEIMRRVESTSEAETLIQFIGLKKYVMKASRHA